jgi:hypothetical protein
MGSGSGDEDSLLISVQFGCFVYWPRLAHRVIKHPPPRRLRLAQPMFAR